MKITKTASGKTEVRISKSEWINIGKKQGWMKKAQENITIFDLINDWGEEGYGIALISPDNKVVDPYIDPSDYPDIILDRSANGAKVISGKHIGCFIIFHSGQLEDKIGEEYVSSTIGQSTQY